MIHTGRHEQIHVNGVCQMPKPNMTRLLGPPQDASEHILTRCTVTGLSHATGPPPNHEYRHRRMSPGDSTEHGGLGMKNLPESELACFSFPFSFKPPHPALISGPSVRDGPSVTQSLSLGTRPLLRRAKRGSAPGFAGQHGLFYRA